MQRNPEELYELGPAAPDIADAPMLHYLEGFIDAGNAGRLLAEHLLSTLPHETVARFDADRLLDYRSRRPLMIYDNSHWESYDAPELALHLLRDQNDRPFLLLTGPEPDHEWKLFTDAVLDLTGRLGVGVAVSFLGIPAGMPHTRPLGVIAHGTRDDLISAHQRLPSRIQLPGSAAALLELRLGETGRDALGFAVQVPHYLAQAVYPPAALALLGSVVTATGLGLPDDELREASGRTNEAIERQVAESAEVAELVRALEQQYDTAAETNGRCPGGRAAGRGRVHAHRRRARGPVRTVPGREPGPHRPAGAADHRGSGELKDLTEAQTNPSLRDLRNGRHIEEPVDVDLLSADVASVPGLAHHQRVQCLPGKPPQVGPQGRVVRQAVDAAFQPAPDLAQPLHQRVEVRLPDRRLPAQLLRFPARSGP